MIQKAIWTIILVMSFAMLGIIGVQAYSIFRALQLNNELFDNNVHAALDHVVSKLEQAEIKETATLYNLPDLTEIEPNRVALMQIEEISTYLEADSSLHYSEAGNVSNDALPKLGDKQIFRHKIHRTWQKGEEEAFISKFTTYFTHHRIVQDVEVEKRLSMKQLDTILRNELVQKGITSSYAYGVYSNQKDTFVLLNNLCKDEQSGYRLPKDFKYQANLYPSNTDQVAQLFIDFPSHYGFIWQGIWLNLLGSILFTSIIIFCFYYTIKVIFEQKKLSEMKNDFLNNMTHEFKTPIATISLASDAIKGMLAAGKPEKAARFVGIIQEENKRMDSQVGKVLQMARIDKEEFTLNLSPVGTHDIIRKAADHLTLRLEKKDGKIELDLQAKQEFIEADETHFANVINNLLDNANKYTPESPHITIRTKDVNAGIRIEIEDNGIGINKEARRHIFDKFYRVHTGDLHDIKGFGLGLSYVKAIVTAHAGAIEVKSELGKGSTFILTFPHKQPTKT